MEEARKPQQFDSDTLVAASLAGNVIVGVVTQWPKIRILTSGFKGDLRRIGEEADLLPLYWKISELASPDDTPKVLKMMKEVIGEIEIALYSRLALAHG